jgi:hypothetical protein
VPAQGLGIRTLTQQIIDGLFPIADHDQLYRKSALPQGSPGDLNVRGAVLNE